MITVDKERFWIKLVDYYYDNVHWSQSDIEPKSTIKSWLYETYHAHVGIDTIEFVTPEKYTWFMLRWS